MTRAKKDSRTAEEVDLNTVGLTRQGQGIEDSKTPGQKGKLDKKTAGQAERREGGHQDKGKAGQEDRRKRKEEE